MRTSRAAPASGTGALWRGRRFTTEGEGSAPIASTRRWSSRRQSGSARPHPAQASRRLSRTRQELRSKAVGGRQGRGQNRLKLLGPARAGHGGPRAGQGSDGSRSTLGARSRGGRGHLLARRDFRAGSCPQGSPQPPVRERSSSASGKVFHRLFGWGSIDPYICDN